tara:strand:- start:1320 stop:2120 length:801 start_codon:yes stop_codon:yes gene_type:complete
MTVNKNSLRWIYIALALISGLLIPHVGHAVTLEMGFIETDAKPFKWRKNGKFIGPFLDIMDEAARRVGIVIKTRPLPSKRLLFYLERGNTDGAFGLTQTAKRKDFAVYADTPIGWTATHVFARKGEEIPFRSLSDLYGKKIAVVLGINLGAAFNKADKDGKFKILRVRNYSNLSKVLSLERVEIAIAPTAPFLAEADKLGLTNSVAKLPAAFVPFRRLHVMFSKAAPFPHKKKLLAKLNKALSDMQKQKEFDKIYRKYGFLLDPRN